MKRLFVVFLAILSIFSSCSGEVVPVEDGNEIKDPAQLVPVPAEPDPAPTQDQDPAQDQDPDQDKNLDPDPAQDTDQAETPDPTQDSDPVQDPGPTQDPAPVQDPDPDPVGELISSMTAEERAWQLIVAAPEDLTGGGAVTDCEALSDALESCPVGGVVLFGANIVDPEQTLALNAGIRDSLPLAPFICVDEEGGAVARVMRSLGTTKIGPMYDYRAEGPDRARENALTIGRDIAGFGFNVDFAPVADVWSNKENTVIGKRAYSDDPAEASALVAAAVEGFHEAGMICTLKHFPGHGDTVADSHTGQAVVELDREEIYDIQFPPFTAGIEAGADMVMVGHLTVPALDGDIATVSHDIVTGILREELDFQGVIITDSLKMSAAAELYDNGELAVRCIEAGCDILLMPASPKGAVEAILAAVESGRLTQERIDMSVRRILELKLKYGIIEI